MGRPCCGGSCIGGNCKAVRKSPTFSSRRTNVPIAQTLWGLFFRKEKRRDGTDIYSEKVVFHIESDGQVGTVHDLKSGKEHMLILT